MANDPTWVSAPLFVVDVTAMNIVASFSELQGIVSEVEVAEYIVSDNSSGLNHTKQFGKVKPPTVTLKRGLDMDGTGMKMWAWHEMAIKGVQTCRSNATLAICMPGAPGEPIKQTPFNWMLENCWISKCDIAGLKAGATDVPLITVTLTCDRITPA
ncbi:MAG: phage tail protein [Actinomycetota bacterium]|nr:phage tail protein [Actinomycetota bacterium]